MRRMPPAVHARALPGGSRSRRPKFPANREFFEKYQGMWAADMFPLCSIEEEIGPPVGRVKAVRAKILKKDLRPNDGGGAYLREPT